MIGLERPEYAVADVFAACISRVRDIELKRRLVGVTQAVIDSSAEFDDAATHNRLHQIVPQRMVGGAVTQAEMESVYSQRMAKKGAPGRDVYDALFTAAPQGRCPLCGQRTVSTLDHHLPKARFPSLSVAPLNLVPACSDCNKAKLVRLPSNAAEETLHPYFDNIDDRRWLRAEVLVGRPAAVRFSVEAPGTWSAVMKQRVEHHFRVFGLGRLYSSEAADELLNIRHQLQWIHDAGGMESVRAEMLYRAESCRRVRLNGWRTATFDAFALSDWFCDGGFLQ